MVNDLLKAASKFYKLSQELPALENKTSELRKNFAKFHKLADCLPGDPLCGDIGDYKAEPLEPKKPEPKPAPKPDANKADDTDPNVRQPTSFTRENVRQPASTQVGDPDSLVNRGPKTVRQPTSFTRENGASAAAKK